MNHVNIIGELHVIGDKENGRQYFGMKTTQTTINDVTEEIEKRVNFHPCVATGRWLNTLDTMKVGAEIAIEGRLINYEDGSMGVEVNDLIIL